MAANAPLTIRFATDVASAKSGIQDLASSVVSNMIKVASAVKTANDNVGGITSTLQKLPAAVKGIAGAYVAYEAFNFVLNATSDAARAAQDRMEGLVKIANQAQGAGVGTSFYQGLTLQAKELGTETEKLQQMLTRARDASTLHIGEAGSDGDSRGPTSIMGDRLKQNVLAGNLSQADLDRFTGAQNQEQRIRVILDLIEQLQQKGAQLAALDLAGKMFGSDFELQLRTGVEIIGKMRDALDGKTVAGGQRIIPPEEIERAKEINEQIQATRNIIAESLRPLQQDIAQWELTQLAAYGDMYSKVGDLVQILAQVYAWLNKIGDALTDLGNASVWGKIYDGFKYLGLTNSAVQDLTDADRAALKRKGAPADSDAGGPLKITVRKDTSKNLPSLHPSAGASEGDDAIERYLKQLQKASDTAKAELESVGKTNVEREKAIDLAKLDAAAREAGRTATEDERAKVVQLAEATAKMKDRTLDAKQALEQAAEAMRNFGQLGVEAISDMLVEGKSFSDVLTNIEKQLAKQLLSAAIMGSGPLAGVLGLAAPSSAGSNASGGLLGLLGTGLKGAMSGFRANGGPVSAGRAYTVGELGQELFVPNQDGRMVPIDRSGGMGGGGVSFTFNDHAGVSAQPQVRRGTDGSLHVMVDIVTRHQAQQAAKGRGELVRTGAVSQRLRG